MQKFITLKFGIFILVIISLVPIFTIQADDTGMVKARLFEDSTGVYVMEVDIASQLLGYISFPKLPERFKGSERTELDGDLTLVTARYFFSCTARQSSIVSWVRAMRSQEA